MTEDVQGKRQRGRPKGTGKDDTNALRAVAHMLAREPELRPMTAMKKLTGEPNGSTIHRLMVKWRRDGSTLLAKAQDRQRRENERLAQERFSAGLNAGFAKLAEVAATFGPALERLVEGAANFAVRPEVQEAFLRLRNFEINPAVLNALQRMRNFEVNPAVLDALQRMRLQVDPSLFGTRRS